MGVATVNIYKNRVTKTFAPGDREKFEKELTAYKSIPFAAPKLLGYHDTTLIIEKCIPLLELEKDKRHRQQLWNLLQDIHNAGFWHKAIALRNVVMHPVRGILLIDFEESCKATSDVSYDLYGAVAAKFKGYIKEGAKPNGIWWGFDWDECPEKYWK